LREYADWVWVWVWVRLRRVSFGGDSVFSFGGRGVDVSDVLNAVAFATSAEDRDGRVLVTGPSLDGSQLTVVASVDEDGLYVTDVAL